MIGWHCALANYYINTKNIYYSGKSQVLQLFDAQVKFVCPGIYLSFLCGYFDIFLR